MTGQPPAPVRKKLRRRESPGGIRFVTFSCHLRLPLLGNPAIRDFLAGTLAEIRAADRLRLYAWIVMPEHAHLLLEPSDNRPLAPSLQSLKNSVARTVLWRWKKLNAPVLERLRVGPGKLRFWLKGGGFDRNVRDDKEFCKSVTYAHRNPVERGLVEQPEAWRWSSVRWWMGLREGELECDKPPGWDRGLKLWQGFK